MISRYLPLAAQKQPPSFTEVQTLALTLQPTSHRLKDLGLWGLCSCFEDIHKPMLIFIPKHQQFVIGSPWEWGGSVVAQVLLRYDAMP